MASNISQLVGSENPTPISAKNMVNADQSQQRKMALGDIKNAPSAFDKSPSKNLMNGDEMSQRKMVFEKSPLKLDDMNDTTEEFIGSETASSKFVDYSNIWSNNLVLTDDEITRWIDMLNAARTMPMTPPKRPPTPPSFDQECPMPEIEFEPFSPPPLPDDDDDDVEDDAENNDEPEQFGSPLDSSMYYSFESTFELEL